MSITSRLGFDGVSATIIAAPGAASSIAAWVLGTRRTSIPRSAMWPSLSTRTP